MPDPPPQRPADVRPQTPADVRPQTPADVRPQTPAHVPRPQTIAHVLPLTTTRAIRQAFDYRLTDAQAAARVGSLLRIEFGRRRTLGVVVGLSDHSELAPERLAEPLEILPLSLPPELVSLAGWLACEYCSTPARALTLMLPPGTGGRMREKEVLVAELTSPGIGAAQDPATPRPPQALAQRPLTPAQHALLGELLHRGPTPAAELGTSALRRLERRGLVRLSPARVRRRPSSVSLGTARPDPPPLTPAQSAATERVLAAIAMSASTGADPTTAPTRAAPTSPPTRTAPTPQPSVPPEEILLHGVTGSGKTEVYLRAVEAVLASGRTAIVLVPEIGLTPQTVERFTARFGDVVAILHSSMGDGERFDEWLRLRRGEARVCVGPRSAVFAPLPDLGLIILDEEHDASYKHEGDPRYDARTVARRRARAAGAVLVAGSATPRPEAVVWFEDVRLPDRVDGRPLPPVEVLDMRGSHHPLHPQARLALADVRREAGKAIVLMNRRGWSNFLACRSCGRAWMCPNCDVGLVLHRGGGYMACHHCGHRERVPERCPQCASVALARFGAGTERLEHDIHEALGDQAFPVFRLDADVSAQKDAAARTLAAFAAAPAGVLVGTQMVAKGHDFPDVTLGVVLDADSTLRFPDFRAEERTFSLITQLAGRAGRGGRSGRVFVQTLAPDARAIRFAAHHDSSGFLAGELERRRVLGYPPFGTLIRVIASSVEPEPAQRTAAELHRRLAVNPQLGLDPPRASLLGPAPLFRLRGRHRTQLVLKTPERAVAIAAVGEAVEAVAGAASRAGVNLSVDVDPQ